MSGTTSAHSSPIVFSGYGELSSPESLTSYSHNPRSKRRRSSAPSRLAGTDNVCFLRIWHHKPIIMIAVQKTDISMQIQNPVHEEVRQLQPPSASKEPVDLTNKTSLTSRPVFVREPSPDDATNAVVLRARFEKLAHATPRKFFLRPKVSL